MKWLRYGIEFPKSGLHFEDGGDPNAAQGNPAAGGDQGSENMVPVSVVQAIRDELNTLKDQNLILQGALRERQGAQAQVVQQPNQNQGNQFDPDEILTAGQVVNLIDQAKQTATAEIQAGNEKVKAQKLVAQPDFKEVLDKHWMKIYNEDPEYHESVMAKMTPFQRAAYAYKLGKTDPEFITKSTKVTPSSEGPTNANNQKVRSPASTGVAVVPQTEDASYWGSLNDADFDKIRAEKRRAGRK